MTVFIRIIAGKCRLLAKMPYVHDDEVPMQITELLDLRDLQAARMVCKQWKLGLSMGVTKLRPRMEANAVGLQWMELHKLQVRIP